MPDEDVRVALARLGGRLDGITAALERIDTACERRAAEHVDRGLYSSERKTLRTEVARNSDRISDVRTDLERQISQLQRDLAKVREDSDAAVRRLDDRITDSRRHATLVAATIIVALIGAIVTVLT